MDKKTKVKSASNPCQYVTTSALKERGWTDGLIKKFLGEPDDTKPNPHYRSAAPMKLYDMKRVEKTERSAKFKAEKEKSATRKQSAAKAVETKREKALTFAREVKINVPTMDYDKLMKKACWSYNEWHQYDRDGYYNIDFEPADPKQSDHDFLARIATNYLRHKCTSYEQQLHKLYGKTGVQDAHDILQQRINDEICRVYPQLK